MSCNLDNPSAYPVACVCDPSTPGMRGRDRRIFRKLTIQPARRTHYNGKQDTPCLVEGADQYLRSTSDLHMGAIVHTLSHMNMFTHAHSNAKINFKKRNKALPR